MRDNQASNDAIDLHGLPVFVPSAALWPRVVAQQQRRVRAQRWRQGGFALAAAAVVCAAVILLPRPSLAPASPILADQSESRLLEGEWQRLASPSRPDVVGLMRVRMIDATLQAAYDRGAGEDELTVLWRQRNQALRGLIARLRDTGDTDVLAVTRI